MTEQNRRAFHREDRCGGNEDFIYLCQTAEMPGGASQNATHLPAPFVGTYNYGCVSGMARRTWKAAAVRQRYNTLDFASKVVCQQGCCSPLLETQSRRNLNFGSPFGLPGGYPSKKKGWKSHARQRTRRGDGGGGGTGRALPKRQFATPFEIPLSKAFGGIARCIFSSIRSSIFCERRSQNN